MKPPFILIHFTYKIRVKSNYIERQHGIIISCIWINLLAQVAKTFQEIILVIGKGSFTTHVDLCWPVVHAFTDEAFEQGKQAWWTGLEMLLNSQWKRWELQSIILSLHPSFRWAIDFTGQISPWWSNHSFQVQYHPAWNQPYTSFRKVPDVPRKFTLFASPHSSLHRVRQCSLQAHCVWSLPLFLLKLLEKLRSMSSLRGENCHLVQAVGMAPSSPSQHTGQQHTAARNVLSA